MAASAPAAPEEVWAAAFPRPATRRGKRARGPEVERVDASVPPTRAGPPHPVIVVAVVIIVVVVVVVLF